MVLTQLTMRGDKRRWRIQLKYNNGNFNAYANFYYSIMRAIDVESIQYLIGGQTNSISHPLALYRRHATMTGSAGMSYRWYDTTLTAT